MFRLVKRFELRSPSSFNCIPREQWRVFGYRLLALELSLIWMIFGLYIVVVSFERLLTASFMVEIIMMREHAALMVS